jgi:hypothetical protein
VTIHLNAGSVHAFDPSTEVTRFGHVAFVRRGDVEIGRLIAIVRSDLKRFEKAPTKAAISV